MIERSSPPSEAQDPGPQARCVCGEKVTIADAREVTLPTVVPVGKATALRVAGLCSLLVANRRAADAPELRPRVVWPAQRSAARVDACLAVASERDRRRYVERPVSEDGFSRILDAGGIAGSAKNGQAWRFLSSNRILEADRDHGAMIAWLWPLRFVSRVDPGPALAAV
jgi:hypothetical protein